MAGKKGKAGRKAIGSVLFIRAPQAQREYLERVRVSCGLTDLSAAGRFVLSEAERLCIGTDATVAEPQERAA